MANLKKQKNQVMNDEEFKKRVERMADS